MIIAADADLDELVPVLAKGGFYHAGQVCVSVQRVFSPRDIARDVAEGSLAPDDINEETISSHLYTAGMSDPDLLIRTAGEMRVSNFLLWQIAYAELYFTDVHWPSFSMGDLYDAIETYQIRRRRYGG